MLEKIPLLLMSGVLCVITLKTQVDVLHQAAVLTFRQRIENAIVSFTTYLGQFFYPAKLAVFYPVPVRRGFSFRTSLFRSSCCWAFRPSRFCADGNIHG